MVVLVGAQVHVRAIGAVLGVDTFDDPENARVILLSAGGLLLLAVLVGAGTIWWWRSSKVEHPALGPLEVMGSRSWFKGDYTSRRRRLEAARPGGAEPTDVSGQPASAPLDLEAAAMATPPRFDDLADPSPLASADELLPVVDEHTPAGSRLSPGALDEWPDLAEIDEVLSRPIDPLLRSQQRE